MKTLSFNLRPSTFLESLIYSVNLRLLDFESTHRINIIMKYLKCASNNFTLDHNDN